MTGGGVLLFLETNIAPATITTPTSKATMIMVGDVLPSVSPQHCLYFIPLPHLQGLFRPVFIMGSLLCKYVERDYLPVTGVGPFIA